MRTENFKYLYKDNYAIRLNNGIVDHVTTYHDGTILFSEPFDPKYHDGILELFQDKIREINLAQ